MDGELGALNDDIKAEKQKLPVRNQYIEVLRVVSALGIIWFHAKAPGADIAYAGLAVFILITFVFEAGINYGRQRSLSDYVPVLIIPWAVWFVIYAALNIVKGKSILPTEHGITAGVLYGSSPHLWYVPFIVATLVGFGWFKLRFDKRSVAIGAAGAGVVFILAIPVWRGHSLLLGAPIAQYMQAMPMVLLGIFFGAFRELKEGVLIAVGLIGVLVVGIFLPHGDDVLVYAIGVLAVLAALELGRIIPLGNLGIAHVSQAMLGVYLIHPLILTLTRPIVGSIPILWVLATFAVSLAAIMAARRFLPRIAVWIS